MSASQKEYLTIKEAAGILRVSPFFMRNIVAGRRGKSRPVAVKLGNIYRIPTEDFRRWLKKKEI